MIEAWVDGSFVDRGVPIASWAFVVVENGEVFYEEYDNDVPDIFLESRNVSGEIYAMCKLVEFCLENEETDLTVHYDYEGLEKWATGSWKANKKLTQDYKKFLQESKLNITWVKVKSHSGDTWNEYVDNLAKSALGDLSEYVVETNFSKDNQEEKIEEKDVNEETNKEIVEDKNYFDECVELFKCKKYIEVYNKLKPFINKDSNELEIMLYIDTLIKLGSHYSEKAVNYCEKYIQLNPRTKVLRSYVYALYYAYIEPLCCKSEMDLHKYVKARESIFKIIKISKNEKILNEIVYPFIELAQFYKDKKFIKMLPSLFDINKFDKTKPNLGGMIYPSKFEIVFYYINLNK